MKAQIKFFVILALSFLLSSNTFSLPVTVNGSVSSDYPDLTSAFDAINLGTHGNGAISVLINESHTLISPATLNGGVFTSCVIKPTADVTVDGNFLGAMIIFDGADRVTIDGRIGVVNNIKLTLTNIHGGIEMKNGASENVVKFIQINTDLYSESINISQSIPGTGGNNNNSIEDSNLEYIISNGSGGISGYTNGGTKMLRNNCGHITLGDETRDNEVRDNKCAGIYLTSVGVNNIIGNKIFPYGINIAPNTITSPGSNATEINVLNNFICYNHWLPPCDNFCSLNLSALRFITGNVSSITANISYNTISLNGNAPCDIWGCYNSGLTTGCEINVTNGNAYFKNNIIENNFSFFRYSNLINISTNANIDADYNCYYTSPVLARWNNVDYSGLDEYRTAAFPNEQHSIFKNVSFADLTTGDLHLAGASVMDEELQGIQIPGITTDIDGELRNSPFMGADEADYLLPVELTSFTSSVNNNDVHLNWTTASETNNSGFDLERSNVKGQTSDVWSKISFINGHGTTSSPNNYEFIDKGLNAGKYKYRLKQIDFNGNYEYYNLVNEVVVGVPDKYSLSQNYPNPFNPTTNLEFGISNLEFVSLKVYNVLGKEVATLVNDELSPGMYEVKFDGSNLSSGVYFYKLTAGNFSAVKKMFLMK